MMLSQMVGMETGAIVGLRDAQAILVEICERAAMPVEMVEDTEFHLYLVETTVYTKP
jgi:hypothetical protein